MHFKLGQSAHIASLIAAALLLCGGCATKAGNPDPHEKINRFFYKGNENLDRFILKPLSKVYVKIFPRPVRTGLGNAFDNLAYGNVVVNDLLQGRWGEGLGSAGRMAVNTTVGLAGTFDVATKWGLEAHRNDFGVTLAKWGAKDPGAYLYLPLFGPSAVRDAPAIPVGMVTSPLYWVHLRPEVRIPLNVLGLSDKRSRADEDIEFRKKAALDPYVFTREAYLQYRRVLIFGEQAPPNDDFYEEMEPVTRPATQENKEISSESGR